MEAASAAFFFSDRLRDGRARQFQALKATENEAQDIFSRSTFLFAAQHLS
ncbi:hypothetical protein [Pseudomonas sp. CFBP13528]|nr:hypothetical protein [Pseudomonas sp. CFBP13528]